MGAVQVLGQPGRAVALAVGGAEESLLSQPHTLDLVLKKRQGFVRLALEAGKARRCSARAHSCLTLSSVFKGADVMHSLCFARSTCFAADHQKLFAFFYLQHAACLLAQQSC